MNDFWPLRSSFPRRSPLLASHCAILVTAFCQCSPLFAPNESIIWGWCFRISLGEHSTCLVMKTHYMAFSSTRTRRTFPNTILSSYTDCSFPPIRHQTFLNLIHPNKQIPLSNTNHGFLTLLVPREINQVLLGTRHGTRRLMRTNQGISLIGLSSGFSLAEISSSCSFS